ncbi:MAG: hypothetical protein H6867_05725 [Rhodospirillales bacterium]|nr:hypothetical protein [Rhodospirillales bacterium]MCB9995026.1 hypothetical protein [Rhodospirillales bacterium]
MSAEVDWIRIGELAKAFKGAVDAKIKEGLDISSVEDPKDVEFFNDATAGELFTILGANLAENFVLIAEIYATLAERKGLSDDFKALVPEEAKTEDVRIALVKTAPTFAKLCM